MMAHWALDLGTTNTALARWDAEADRPRLVRLDAVCRAPDADDPLQAPGVVPSATHMVHDTDLWTTLGRRPWLSRRVFWGTHAHIGRQALELNQTRVHPGFAPSFKPHLGRAPLRPLARLGKRTYTTRDVARAFLRELLAQVKRDTGERIRELMVTAPVDAYESYRAELKRIANGLGVHRLRFVDEPVAAAAGYGVSVRDRRRILVVDFGGGTLDVALVVLDARQAEQGACHVIAKSGRPVGGETVDRWLLAHVCAAMGARVPDEHDLSDLFWHRWLLSEARRLKESLFFRHKETFFLAPPDELREVGARLLRGGGDPYYQATRDELVHVLELNGLYRTLRTCTEEVLAAAAAAGVEESDIDDVLMVGGSNLLPHVFTRFEEWFGRDRVRAWQPFDAVVNGACALSARGFHHTDFIVHDYAFVAYDAATHQKQYITIIPGGTRFPTAPDFWRQRMVPTCPLGEPERVFKLVVCEVGSARGDRTFGWDAAGELHVLGGRDRLVVPLNESSPTMGNLDPPHPPSDKRPRLDVMFGVNEDRWLVATVNDLKSGRVLMRGAPVVRLL